LRERADGLLGGAGAGAGSTAAAAVSLCSQPLAQALIAAEAEMARRMRHAERRCRD